MNRSFRAQEAQMQATAKHRQQLGILRTSMMKGKEEELALFLEMRECEKEQSDLLLHDSEEFDAPLGSKPGTSSIFNITSSTLAKKNGVDDFLNSENDKNDYEWLLTPPGTPLFPSLEMESKKTVTSHMETPKARPVALKSRLANPLPEPADRSKLTSRQTAPSTGLSTSVVRRPSSRGSGSRSATPTGRVPATKPTMTTAPKPTSTVVAKLTSTTVPKPSRSSTPTSRTTLPSSKPTVPPRSATPLSRNIARSSTPTSKATLPAPKPTSRATTPTRRPTSLSTLTNTSSPPTKSPSSSLVTNPVASTAKNPVPPRASSPTVKPRKPSEISGVSLDPPPNLRTSLPNRLVPANRGRPGAPIPRSSSVEPVSNGRVRRQSCSPARGRAPNGMLHTSGSSVPAINRLHAKANDNVSPVLIGTKMVERMMNMRKLAPPKQDDKHSPRSNLSKSSSPDSSGFGRSFSKKSLDMAIRHMDIRRSITGNLRPSMAKIPASSMYSMKSCPTENRTISVSDSPLPSSSNASTEVSVNNNGLCLDGSAVDIFNSEEGVGSPASVQGR